jgi:hypothetical protein
VYAVSAAEFALKEFDALRAEILARQQQQAASIGVGLTAAGTILGFALAKDNPRTEMLLAIPLVLTGLACFYIWNARFTRRIGLYIQDLPRAALSCDRETWEERVAGYWAKTALEALGVVIIFIIPSVVSLVVTDHYRKSEQLQELWYAGCVLLGLLLVFVVAAVITDWLAEMRLRSSRR